MGCKTIRVSGFPINVTSTEVMTFLESKTGAGTVYALKIRPPNIITPRSKAFAMVQFTSRECADVLSLLANQKRLRFGILLLFVQDMERDIVPKPRTPMFKLQDSVLHFGCQISEDRFLVLWSGIKVQVHFGFELKKLHFLLSCNGVSYKLDLTYESIWEIQLRRCDTKHNKFLLFQVQAAPRIYEKLTVNSGHFYDDPNLNFFRDLQDDQWVRTTDFTPSSSIGQSSALCLELPYNCKLPDIHEYFYYYKEVTGRYNLEDGLSYSHSLDLVPVLGPPDGCKVPYKVLFQINHMVQLGTLVAPTLDRRFFDLVNPDQIPLAYIERALEELSYLKTYCFDPAKYLDKKYAKYCKAKFPVKSLAISLDDGLVYTHRVQITPSKVYFYGPEINVSNRVLRKYPQDIDNFIRISFVDEEADKMRSMDLSSRVVSMENQSHTKIYRRILSTLRDGICIGEKRFEFLAFSSSQLRENSAWMFASRNGLTASDIRRWMGDFSDIKNVAKYAARLGQSFSSSTETLHVQKDEIQSIPDIKKYVHDNGKQRTYIFSDGIGKISPEFARKVASKCGLKSSTPSAFQIRYGGYKGVVAIDPTSTVKLSLRQSMLKYNSENTSLDVLAWSKYQPCFLNRQIITLLSTLGVEDHVFETKQQIAIDQLDRILTDPLIALEALTIMSPGENNQVLKDMLTCGYKPNKEPFLSMMLQTLRASKLLELKTKSRIFEPNGRSMMGCLDETGTLAYGQAVDVPDLHHMIDCVVFPQRGERPHPNECSGSDLDGDIYFVSWDPALIPSRQVPPMEYDPAPTITLDHDVSIEDFSSLLKIIGSFGSLIWFEEIMKDLAIMVVQASICHRSLFKSRGWEFMDVVPPVIQMEVQEYFTNYIVNDSLGVIANAHTAFADREEMKAESKACIELAKLFSIAVDFNKTGVAAQIPPELQVKEYPDFMNKPDKPTYESKRVIGKLFRAVKDVSGHISKFTMEVARCSYDPEMEYEGFEEYLSEASYFKNEYDMKLGNLMDHYEIKTESEILSGYIMKMGKTYTKNRDSEAIRKAVRSLKKEARSWFNEKDNHADVPVDEMYAKASAWYYVTYHPTYWGYYNEGLKRPHFLSFPWCVYDKLIHIKQQNKRRIMEMEADLLSLRHRMEASLRLG
ncbi:RNA-dependent RNA polymerase 1 [Acorus calamus]|uniref:RNA-dependent RNA polymerase n=1 Tax=Acorus calamus TaxID=4465 RepID=A0AAV9EKL0_ACOCL|nr:RNA-dependent RNA polymerase 1 [Acorus calamus]